MMRSLVPFNRKETDLLGTNFDDFGNMLDDFFAGDRLAWPTRRSLAADTFKVDIQEKDKEYLVEAELPGVKKEEVKVDVEEGRLKISIHKEEKKEEKDENYIHRERRTTSMHRSMYLDGAQSEGIKAKLEEGVLQIIIPKAEKSAKAVSVKID